ncbi:MAG: nuclear transport factor 2 family protein [Rhodoferax sp.]|nr:nuclear transport factor 2 family protein [Rhodoferax sp.]
MTTAPTDRTDPLDHTAQVAQIVRFFETLSPQSVAQLGQFYAPQARFTDPFNNVVGVAAISAIFDHMFVSLQQPRFVVVARVLQGSQCFLTWEFRFGFKGYQAGQAQVILGASHLVLSDTGLITVHRDYWDAAQELYEKLPLLGGLMRWLRARLQAR